MAPKAAAVVTAVVMMEKTMVIEAVVLSLATRTIVTTGRVVISIPTADVTTQRPCNVSTRTTNMAPTYGTGTFTKRPEDSPTRSPLGLVVVKVMEEVDAALVTAEAVDEAAEDSKAVAAFRVVAVDAATVMTTTVAVVKVTTTEIKARIVEAPHKDLIIRATGAVTITVCTRLQCSLDNKVA